MVAARTGALGSQVAKSSSRSKREKGRVERSMMIFLPARAQAAMRGERTLYQGTRTQAGCHTLGSLASQAAPSTHPWRERRDRAQQ
jgi:hypothetical protein